MKRFYVQESSTLEVSLGALTITADLPCIILDI
jgi:hypothetical protein